MKSEEMALKSEIRQMLNEAGFNREYINDIVNNPSKHIKIIKVNGEDTICYSQQFVKLLELLECIISER